MVGRNISRVLLYIKQLGLFTESKKWRLLTDILFGRIHPIGIEIWRVNGVKYTFYIQP